MATALAGVYVSHGRGRAKRAIAFCRFARSAEAKREIAALRPLFKRSGKRGFASQERNFELPCKNRK
jgi:hypothetical protein